MIESVVWGVAWGIVVMILMGVRRQPWRYCAVVGLGFGLVFGTLRLATLEVDPRLLAVDPGMLVQLGALGGGIATLGFERGERARDRRTAAILRSPPSPVV